MKWLEQQQPTISQNRAECYEVSFIYHTEIWQTLLSQSNTVWAGVKFVCLNETNDGLKMEKYKCAAVLTSKIDLRYFLPQWFAPETQIDKVMSPKHSKNVFYFFYFQPTMR